MSEIKLKQTGSSGNICGVEVKTRPPKTTRSATHGRSPSVTVVKSKIPKNVGQNRGTTILKKDQMASPDRPNSQGHAPGRRPVSRNGHLNSTKTKTAALGMHRRSLESQLLAKKFNLASLKKDIEEKQRNAMDLVKTMSQLRDKLIAAGGKDPGKIDPIKLFIDQINSIGGDESVNQDLKKNPIITKELISTIKENINEESREILEICQDVLKKYMEISKYLCTYCKENPEINFDVIKELFIDHEKEKENLNLRLTMSIKKHDDIKLNLVDKVDLLWAEIIASQLQSEHLASKETEVDKLQRQVCDQIEKIKQINEEKILMDERLFLAEERIKELEKINIDLSETKEKLESELEEENLLAEKKNQMYQEKIVNLDKMIQDFETQLKEEKTNNESSVTEKISEQTQKDKTEIENLKEKLKKLDENWSTKISTELKNLSSKFQDKLMAKDKELRELKRELQKVDKTYEIAEKSRKIKSLELDLEKFDRIVREQKKQLTRKDEIISAFKDDDTNDPHGNSKQVKFGEIMQTLEEKISQINKLEIIVKQFENQERSSQEKRTRLERKIAELELEKSVQNKRSKKFGIM